MIYLRDEKTGRLGAPICCDNQKSAYGYEDTSIKRKAMLFAVRHNKRFPDTPLLVVDTSEVTE